MSSLREKPRAALLLIEAARTASMATTPTVPRGRVSHRDSPRSRPTNGTDANGLINRPDQASHGTSLRRVRVGQSEQSLTSVDGTGGRLGQMGRLGQLPRLLASLIPGMLRTGAPSSMSEQV
jgi:hypothetical protein